MSINPRYRTTVERTIEVGLIAVLCLLGVLAIASQPPEDMAAPYLDIKLPEGSLSTECPDGYHPSDVYIRAGEPYLRCWKELQK